jgi:hypothetical protein
VTGVFCGSRVGVGGCARLTVVDLRVWEGSGGGAGVDADSAGADVVHGGFL